jgi:hypothetical protein
MKRIVAAVLAFLAFTSVVHAQAISSLPRATTVAPDDLFSIAQATPGTSTGYTTKSLPFSVIQSTIGTGGGGGLTIGAPVGGGVNNSLLVVLSGNLAQNTSPGGTTQFLRGDLTWAVPPSGTGGGGAVTSGTAGQLGIYAATGTTISGTNAGTGVVTALGVAPGAMGSFTTQNGAITTGDCLKWGPGVQDAGAACGSGGGGSLTVTDGSHPVAGTTNLTFSGATVSGTTPNATVTITGGGGGTITAGTTPTSGFTTGQYLTSNGSVVTAAAGSGLSAIPPNTILANPSPTVTQTPVASKRSDIVATDYGMQSSIGAAFDNSPFVQALMNSAGQASVCCYGGPTITFPPNPNNLLSTDYYFTQPFVLSRGARINCGGSAKNGGSGGTTVRLIFAAGVDGFEQDQPLLTDDGGSGGGSDINGCSVWSVGYGTGFLGGNVIAGIPTVHTGGSGYIGTSGTMTWNTSGCSTNPVLNVTASGGVINAVTSVVNPGFCSIPGESNNTSWSAGGGLSGGSGASFTLVLTPTANTNTVTGIFMGTIIGASYAIVPQAGDGVIVLSYQPTPGGFVGHGAYLASYNTGTHVATLAAGYTIPTTIKGIDAIIYDLPVSQKYTITSTIGSNVGTILSGPRPIKPGAQIWTDAFPMGTVIMQVSSSIAGSVTVHSAGSGFTGASGTMTWSGLGCSTNPVLNVTASGGAITGVSSVANGGVCNSSWPSSTATTWTAGGALSGGSGAAFNMTFNESYNVTDIATSPSGQVASVTHTSGSPGQMWEMPTGIMRRVGSSTHGSGAIGFGGAGMAIECYGAFRPATGCNGSFDQEGVYDFDLIGRLDAGDNSGGATDISDAFSSNFVSDIIEASQIGSLYLGGQSNSAESGTSNNAAISLCLSENQSVFIGMYAGSIGAHGMCMAQDGGGNTTYTLAPVDGGQVWIGPQQGGGPVGAPSITDGGMVDGWAFTRGKASTINNVTSLTGFPCTSFNTLPANSTEVPMFGFAPDTCGSNASFQFIWNSVDLSFDLINLSGGTPLRVVSTANPGVTGYKGYPTPTNIALPEVLSGILMGNTQSLATGTERLFDCGTAAPPDSYRKQGDLHCNLAPSVGGNMFWSETADGAGNWYPAAPISNSKTVPDYTMAVVRSGKAAPTDLTGRVTLAAGVFVQALAGNYTTIPNCIAQDVTTPTNNAYVVESLNTPSGTGSASTVNVNASASAPFPGGAGYPTQGWANTGSPGLPTAEWLEYDYGSGHSATLTGYSLFRSSTQPGGWNNNQYSPGNWTFQGSNDNSTWTTLDTRTAQTIVADATPTGYSFTNSTAYRYYRINITQASTPQALVNITVMGFVPPLGNAITLHGTGTDVVKYICMGEN